MELATACIVFSWRWRGPRTLARRRRWRTRQRRTSSGLSSGGFFSCNRRCARLGAGLVFREGRLARPRGRGADVAEAVQARIARMRAEAREEAREAREDAARVRAVAARGSSEAHAAAERRIAQLEQVLSRERQGREEMREKLREQLDAAEAELLEPRGRVRVALLVQQPPELGVIALQPLLRRRRLVAPELELLRSLPLAVQEHDGLVQRLLLLDKDVDLVTLPEAGHGWDAEGLAQTRFAFRKMVDFFDRHVKNRTD